MHAASEGRDPAVRRKKEVTSTSFQTLRAHRRGETMDGDESQPKVIPTRPVKHKTQP